MRSRRGGGAFFQNVAKQRPHHRREKNGKNDIPNTKSRTSPFGFSPPGGGIQTRTKRTKIMFSKTSKNQARTTRNYSRCCSSSWAKTRYGSPFIMVLVSHHHHHRLHLLPHQEIMVTTDRLGMMFARSTSTVEAIGDHHQHHHGGTAPPRNGQVVPCSWYYLQ
jgi:hypothetical protein